MFRTRDLILFILVLFFLMTAVTATVVRDTYELPDTQPVVFSDVVYEGDAVAEQQSIDRESIIRRLRTKLAHSVERIEPVASVEAPEQEQVEETGDGTLQRCLYPDDALSLVPKWPLKGVQVQEREGARVVYSEEIHVVPVTSLNNASSTVVEKIVTTVHPLLQLPLHARKQTEVSCVPSEVVGVTTSGILMFNGDVNSYRNISENILIGYARDGFPIYGVYTGEVDACGGYDHASGYRYTISTERDYIVGCYVGTPNLFSV